MAIAEATDLIRRSESVSTNSRRTTQQPEPAVTAIEEHAPLDDRDALYKLAGWIGQRISPLVAIETLDKKRWAGQRIHQPDSLLCDISGVTHLFGGETELMRHTQSLLGRHGLTASMAIGDSVGAAWAIAHRTINQDAERSAVQMIAPHGAALSILQPLPAETLRICPQTIATLRRLGVESIGQLLRLPRGGLATRLGQPLVTRIAQVLGEVDEPLHYHHAEPPATAVHELEYPTDDVEILKHRLGILVDEVKARLVTIQCGALSLNCHLDLTAHPPLTLKVGLFAPTLDSDHLCRLLINALERQRLASTAHRITLEITQSAPLRTSQGLLSDSFFDVGFMERSPERSPDQSGQRPLDVGSMRSNTGPAGGPAKTSARVQNVSGMPTSTTKTRRKPKKRSSRQTDGSQKSGKEIARMLDTISGRLGRSRVKGIALSADPLPENAFKTFPLTGSPSAAARVSFCAAPSLATEDAGTDTAPTRHDALRRPTLLFPDPIPVTPTYVVPASFGQPPCSDPEIPTGFRFQNTVYQVNQWIGPERIETGWWSGPQVRRDYFRVETDRGETWWVYRVLPPLGNRSDNAHTEQRDNRSKTRGVNRSESQKSSGEWRLHGLFS